VAWVERRQTHDGKYAGQPGPNCGDTLAVTLVKGCGGQREHTPGILRYGTPVSNVVDKRCHTDEHRGESNGEHHGENTWNRSRGDMQEIQQNYAL